MSSGRVHTSVGLDLAPSGGVMQIPLARLGWLQACQPGAWRTSVDSTYLSARAQTADLPDCVAGAAGTSGIIYLARFLTPPPGYGISGISMYVTTAVDTPTSAQNLVGIYDGSNGATAAKLFTSSDMSTPWGSTGLVTVTPSTPIVPTTSTFLVARVANATTAPIFAKSPSGTGVAGLVNYGATRPASWFGHALTAQTSLPATIDFTGTNVTQDAFATWVSVQYAEL